MSGNSSIMQTLHADDVIHSISKIYAHFRISQNLALHMKRVAGVGGHNLRQLERT